MRVATWLREYWAELLVLCVFLASGIVMVCNVYNSSHIGGYNWFVKDYDGKLVRYDKWMENHPYPEVGDCLDWEILDEDEVEPVNPENFTLPDVLSPIDIIEGNINPTNRPLYLYKTNSLLGFLSFNPKWLVMIWAGSGICLMCALFSRICERYGIL